jgi:cyclophilin family peptidyl-prolyl cis-trans isomerase
MNLKLIILSIFLILLSCSKSKQDKIIDTAEAVKTHSFSLKTDSKGLSTTKAVIKTVHGNIIFQFYPLKAPNTSRRISGLIKKGFYDGLIFHRVIPNFVIQTGDPLGNGQGGSGTKLKAEFNDLPHVRGTVAMARRQDDDDSADSQFYLALKSLPHLDQKYTVFGQVTEGLSIIDQVQRGDKIISLTLVD